MTTASLRTPAPVPAAANRPRGILSRPLRAEWTKLRTLRSTYWTLLATVVATVGIGALASGILAAQWDTLPQAAKAGFDPLQVSLSGITLGQLALAVLGVLVISGEYRTGMIRSSLTATPRRLRFLAAKTVVFALVAVTVGEVVSFAAFFTGQAFLAAEGIEAGLGDPGVARAVVGGGLFLAACGVLGLAIGALLRHTAGAITAVVAALFVVAPLVTIIPGKWGLVAAKYYPNNAGVQITSVSDSAGQALDPWVGYGVFWAWIAAVYALAAWLLVRRDA